VSAIYFGSIERYATFVEAVFFAECKIKSWQRGKKCYLIFSGYP
jgi:hypothetical protein